jgi:hypothetical protein
VIPRAERDEATARGERGGITKSSAVADLPGFANLAYFD